jgi:D-tyrosyl-tRNA(Tyr) deacylase
MRDVLQRVTRARVLVDGDVAGEIGPGLMVLIAVGREDNAATA